MTARVKWLRECAAQGTDIGLGAADPVCSIGNMVEWFEHCNLTGGKDQVACTSYNFCQAKLGKQVPEKSVETNTQITKTTQIPTSEMQQLDLSSKQDSTKKSSSVLPVVLAVGGAAALAWWLLPSMLLENPLSLVDEVLAALKPLSPSDFSSAAEVRYFKIQGDAEAAEKLLHAVGWKTIARYKDKRFKSHIVNLRKRRVETQIKSAPYLKTSVVVDTKP